MKAETDFFIGVLKAAKKAWPTDAESQVVRIKALLRKRPGSRYIALRSRAIWR
jgi:hypothetical protein